MKLSNGKHLGEKKNQRQKTYSINSNCTYSNKANIIIIFPIKLRRKKNNKCYQGTVR